MNDGGSTGGKKKKEIRTEPSAAACTDTTDNVQPCEGVIQSLNVKNSFVLPRGEVIKYFILFYQHLQIVFCQLPLQRRVIVDLPVSICVHSYRSHFMENSSGGRPTAVEPNSASLTQTWPLISTMLVCF